MEIDLSEARLAARLRVKDMADRVELLDRLALLEILAEREDLACRVAELNSQLRVNSSPTPPATQHSGLPRSLQRVFHPQLTPTEQTQLDQLRTRMNAEENPMTDEWMVVDDTTGKEVAGPFGTRAEADAYAPWEDVMVVRVDRTDHA